MKEIQVNKTVLQIYLNTRYLGKLVMILVWKAQPRTVSFTHDKKGPD